MTPIFMIFAKGIDSRVLEFVASNTVQNNQWKNCIQLDFNFGGFSEPQNPR